MRWAAVPGFPATVFRSSCLLFFFFEFLLTFIISSYFISCLFLNAIVCLSNKIEYFYQISVKKKVSQRGENNKLHAVPLLFSYYVII